MSQVLTLASDFIERLSNPAYGIGVNEEYSLRFATLLSAEGFESLLSREVAELTDSGTFSAHGWHWVLEWARSKRIRIDGNLLLELTEKWSSTFMQVAAISLATQRTEWQPRDSVVPLSEFEDQWIAELLRRCTTAHRDGLDQSDHIDTGRSETVLTALMQVGNDVTLDAASTLLNHSWNGQEILVGYFRLLSEQLDEETRTIWLSRLRAPES